MTELKLYNTLSRSKEIFEPLHKNHIGMYVCGPTVYDFAHIGNARPYVIFDILYRLLKTKYKNSHQVTYVRNITDIDDKIIISAQKMGKSIEKLTQKVEKIFLEDMDALNILRPDIQPKATEHLPKMIEMIKILIQKGNAYEADGHVLFSIPSMANYGALSKPNKEELIAGARVDVASYKKDPTDFILWKPSSADQPGWESPWGRGRPGWHLECSAMAAKYLGEIFDIHAGGQDLMFPHHENEIAQSCCAHNTKIMAKTWLHNGYVIINGQKMSKSLGNFVTVHQLLAKWHGETIRMTLLSAHYRQPLDFTDAGLIQAKQNLDRFYGALKDFSPAENETESVITEALCDDLNTPKAIANLHELTNQIYKSEDSVEKIKLQQILKNSANQLGLLQLPAETWFSWTSHSAENILTEAEIDEMIQARINAKKNKDFSKADAIRATLAEKGILLEDTSSSTSWKRG